MRVHRLVNVVILVALVNASLRARTQNDGPTAPSGAEPAVVLKGRAPVSDALVAVHLPVPAAFDLPNGLHVMVLEARRVPQVAVNLVIPGAGGYFDPKDTLGLATFVAAMAREGTTTRTSTAIARQLETMSATLEVTAGTTAPDASVTAVCLSEYFASIVDLMADVVTRPSFPEDELQRYRLRTRALLLQQRATPAFLGNEVLARVVNGDHPAARTSPTLEATERVTRAQLVEFHRARYVPDHAVLIVLGDVSVAEVRNLARAAFERWSASGNPRPEVHDPPSAMASGIRWVARAGSVQTTLMVGAPAIDRRSSDYDALQVLNQVIGAGPTGRLFVHLREEKGYTYGAFSVLTAGLYRGTWIATTDVRSEATGPALRDLLAEIARLRDTRIPKDELAQQKRAMVAGFVLALESPTQLLACYLTQWRYQLPTDYWETYPKRVMAVTADDVQRVAKTYLDPARLRIVAVGDASVPGALASFGPVETADGARPKPE